MKYRIYVILAGLVLAIPFYLLNLSALGTWGGVERAMNGGEETTAPGGLVDVGIGINRLWGDHKEANQKAATFDPTDLTRQRTITLTRPITVAAVLEDGEDTPKPVFDTLYLISRAPSHSMKDCPLILEKMATSCLVGKTEIDTKSSGLRLLTSTYGYAPAYPMGDLSKIDSATVEDFRMRYNRGTGLDSVPLAKLAQTRAKIYQQAVDACDTLRERVGNCVVKSISISERPHDDDPRLFRVKVSVRLAWLKHDGHGPDILAGLDFTPEETASATPQKTGFFGKGALAKVFGIFASASNKSADSTEAATEPPRVLNGGGAFKPAGGAVFKSVGGG